MSAGLYGAALGPVGSSGYLTQTLSTVAGNRYTLNFALANFGGSPNSFSVYFGGIQLFGITDVGTQSYTVYTFSDLVATGALTDLQFAFRQDPSYWGLDAVSVQRAIAAVPEPSEWALLMSGGLLLFIASERRRRRVTISVLGQARAI